MKTLSILIITALLTCMVVKSSEAHRYKKRNSNDLKKAQSDMINNYYTGPNCKEIKQQLSEIKQEIWSLRRVNITDELSSEMRQLLAEIKGDIRELKINLTSGSSLNGLFFEVKQQVAGLKEEVKLLRENLTGGLAGNGLLPEMKQLLAELKEEIMALKGNQTGSQGGTVPITSKPTPTHKPTLPSVPTTSRPIPTPKPTTVYPKNCAEIYKSGNWSSKVYKIDPDGLGEFEVFCDQATAGGGWTVFQKRQDGSVDFWRGWDDYKRGFGNLNGEYWLGLDKIHRLTTSSSDKLRVDLEDNYGKKAFAEYRSFTVGNETAKYQLSKVNNFQGTAGDSLSYHRGMPFTTKDRDNDRWSSHNCASQYKGAWWYNNCHWSNLNGLFRPGLYGGEGLTWYSWKKRYISLRKSEMKLRPNDF